MTDPVSASGLAAAASEPEPISAVDRAWLRMDDPTNLMLISGVLAFDQPLDAEALAAVLERRLLPIRRFRQRVETIAGRHVWVEQPEVDVGDHLSVVRLPAPGGEPELAHEVSRLMSTPLPFDRPLWQFHLFTGYGDGGALFARLHHAIGDGISLMLVLLSLADLEPEPEPEAPNPFAALFDPAQVGIDAARELAHEVMPDGMRLLLKPAEALRAAGRLATGAASASALTRLGLRRADPASIFKGPLGVEKRAAWSAPIELAAVRALRQRMEGTVNDLLLTAATGGLRRYLVHRGERPDGLDFRAAVPVNLRPLERMAELGNQFGLVFLSLPVGVADPADRLAELRRRMRALKRSAEPLVVQRLLRWMGQVPLPVQRAVVKLFATKTTAVMTNVPGPGRTLYLAGRPISDIFFWVPQAGRVGLGVSIMSYAGTVRLGVATDAGLVPDPQRIVDSFHDELDAMQG